jgi:hypothetical protein
MAQDEAYDVRVFGRITDDQGRTLIQETFWYKGSFYMTDRYERADESSEKKEVEDAVPAPPNPTEDGPVEATSAVEVPTSPVETKPAGCTAGYDPEGRHRSPRQPHLRGGSGTDPAV